MKKGVSEFSGGEEEWRIIGYTLLALLILVAVVSFFDLVSQGHF